MSDKIDVTEIFGSNVFNDKVMKERYVKENTIVVNLQNPKYFKKDKEGKYSAVAAE